jgi:hypothetical protein
MLTDPYHPASLRGETLPALDGLTGGIVMTEQQGCRAIKRRHGLRHKRKIFLPYLRKFPGHPCGQRDPYPGKRKDYTWKRPRLDKVVAAAVRQGRTTTENWERVRCDRCHIVSLPSVRMAFYRGTTGYSLGIFLMQMTLRFYLYKKLRRTVWTTLPDT